MMGLLAALAALSWGADAALTSRRPFSLEGARRRICLLMALGVKLWTAAALLPDPSPVRACSWFFLANGLFLTAVTDLLEQMVYDVHFYALLLGGAVSAFLRPEISFPGNCLLFLAVLGVLFLISRRKPGLGMGDSRMIACMALYFPLSRWMEVLLLSLGAAMLYGLLGMVRKQKNLKTELPFMPFLLMGVLLEFMM